MASLIRRLNRITKQQGVSTPVHLANGSSPFVHHGEMNATIEGFVEGANLSWEQISGVPVTYTSSLDGLTITFTTTDLAPKVFRVYTNQGTDKEESDAANFYHGPIDNMTLSSTSVANVVSHGPISQYRNSGIEGAYSYGGIVNTASQPVSTSIHMPRSSDDEFLSVIPHTVLSEDFKNVVISTELQYEASPNNWVTEDTVTGYAGMFGNLAEVSGASRRVVYQLYRLGERTSITTPPIDFSTGGYQEQLTNHSTSVAGILSMSTILSTKVTRQESDTLTTAQTNIVGLIGVNTALQTLRTSNQADTLATPTSTNVALIKDVVTVIQSNVSVG